MVEQEEDEVRISSFPLLKARRPADHIEPRIHPNQSPDTPHSVRASTEAPHSEHRHPSNEHQAKPKYRREMYYNRTEPPLNRARARERTQDHISFETQKHMTFVQKVSGLEF